MTYYSSRSSESDGLYRPCHKIGDAWIWDDRYDAYVTATGEETDVDFFYNFDEDGSRMFTITAYDETGSFVISGYADTSSAGTIYTVTITLEAGYTWTDGTEGPKTYTFMVLSAATPVTDPVTAGTAYEDANGDYYTKETGLEDIFTGLTSATDACGYTVIVDGVEYTYSTDDFYADDGTKLSGITLEAGTTYEITFALAEGYVWKDSSDNTVTTEDCTYYITVVSGFATLPTAADTAAYKDANGDLYTEETGLSEIFTDLSTNHTGYTVIVDGEDVTSEEAYNEDYTNETDY